MSVFCKLAILMYLRCRNFVSVSIGSGPGPSEKFPYQEQLSEDVMLYWDFNTTYITFEVIVKTNGKFTFFHHHQHNHHGPNCYATPYIFISILLLHIIHHLYLHDNHHFHCHRHHRQHQNIMTISAVSLYQGQFSFAICAFSCHSFNTI